MNIKQIETKPIEWLITEIHRMITEGSDELIDDCNYLTLTYTGNYWAATFGCLFDDDEWFELNSDWPLVARDADKDKAIRKAALLVLKRD